MKKIECLVYDEIFIFDNFFQVIEFMEKKFREDKNLEYIGIRYLENDNE